MENGKNRTVLETNILPHEHFLLLHSPVKRSFLGIFLHLRLVLWESCKSTMKFPKAGVLVLLLKYHRGMIIITDEPILMHS